MPLGTRLPIEPLSRFTPLQTSLPTSLKYTSISASQIKKYRSLL